MNLEQHIDAFRENPAIHIEGLLPPQLCDELIERREKISPEIPWDASLEEIFKECEGRAFTGEVNALLEAYFQSKFQLRWPRFDVVDSTAAEYEYNIFWHLDNGIPNTLKLFVYLDPVAEHGGNTLIIDRERTDALRGAGALPIEVEKRREDLTPDLERLGLDTRHLGYDLKAGDGLLFSPLVLAHKCLAPKAGKKRHTICFTIEPSAG